MRIQGEASIQGSTSWHKLRAEKIGASSVGAIFGVSPYQTAYQLWLERTGRTERNQNANMAYGSSKESDILKSLENLCDLFMMPAVYVADNPDYDFLMASLDGITVDDRIIGEVKVASREIFDKAKKGEVVQHYYLQCQTQLLVTDAEKVLFYAYSPSARDFALVEILPDFELHKEIIERCSDFMECIRKDIPPQMIEGRDIPYQENIIDLENRWTDIQIRKKVIEQEEALVKDMIVSRAGEGCIGNKYQVMKQTRTSYSYADACKSNNVDMTDYAKTSEFWSIKLLK